MLKRELKINFKSFIIWSSIIILMFATVFAIYPSIVSNGDMIDQLMATMPKELLSVFNMDVVSLNKVSGWIATEGYMMITLLGGCYAAILGSNLLTKEEDDKTIEFLYSKPISRGKIYFTKILTGIMYIFLFNICISLTNLLGLLLCNDFDLTKWLLLSLLPILLHLFILFLSLLISNFYNKTRKSMSVCLGMVFLFYMINVISALSDKISFLKYITPFTYVDSSTIMKDSSANPLYLLICSGLTIIFGIVSYKIYRDKEF